MPPPLRYSGCTNISEIENNFSACINETNLQLNSNNDVSIISGKPAFISVFAFLVFLSLVGNITIIVAWFRKILPARIIYFYTVNLACTDLLLTCSISLNPITRHMTGKAGDVVLCKLNFFIIETCLTASILTLVAIGYKRYKKMTSLNIATQQSSDQERRVARKQCLVIWLIAIITSSPLLSAYSVNDKHECIKTKNWPAEYAKLYFVSHFILFFILPLSFLTFVSCRIYSILRGHTTPNAIELNSNHPPQNASVHSPANPRHTKMLLAVVVVFLICVGPIIVTRALAPFWASMASLPRVYVRITQFLYQLNSAIDPLIYCIANREIRNVYKKLLTCT